MNLEQLAKLCDEATPGLLGAAFKLSDYNFIVAARKFMPLLIDVARAAKECRENSNLTADTAQLNWLRVSLNYLQTALTKLEQA